MNDYPVLASIRRPSDLDRLDVVELGWLAEEIRTFLVEAVSKTGGHLSPNLGVVELTIALHRVFDSPRDRIIWDVGHQAYVHKLLTDRQDSFDSLRQTGGLSGYPSRDESPHDFVENSHASTSISYALGLAQARREDDDSFVIAVIGDGALTGGMASEALNHLAQLKPARMVVVLNDNGRSYAPTVGGLARHLARLRLNPRYEFTKKAIGQLLRELPAIGTTADETARRLKESFKQMFQPSTFFDVLGLKYAGPIDGHDLETLERTFHLAKQIDEPVVVHVATDKGRGYEPAIRDERDKLHGVGRFDVETGLPLGGGRATYTDAFGAAVTHVASHRPEIVAVTAAMESSTGLSELAERSPERVYDVGISEQHAVTLAAGLAMGGLRPIVCIYSTFLQRAIDQILMDVALHDQPVVFVVDRSGITGPDGSSHHGVFDLTFLRMVPGMAIASPASADELAGILETATQHHGPVAIRFPKAGVDGLPTLPPTPIPLGSWEERRQGDDVLFLAVGRMVERAEKAATILEEAGVSAGVVNARWVRPMDDRLSGWVEAHDRTFTVEDNVVSGGFGAAVLEHLAGTPLASKVTPLALPTEFVPFGEPEALLARYELDDQSIAARVLNG